jgi:hypothetical protein
MLVFEFNAYGKLNQFTKKLGLKPLLSVAGFNLRLAEIIVKHIDLASKSFHKSDKLLS